MLNDSEIKNAIELFVNSIYNGEPDWLEATKNEWIEAVWEELSEWKNTCKKSNENRFYGKKNVVKRISELLDVRLEELRNEGYKVKVC